MIKIENVDVHGFEAAIRGMRNSFNSWDKSDSVFSSEPYNHNINNQRSDWIKYNDEIKLVGCKLGPNDLKLMQTLANTGRGSERKYLRYITVTADITAPLYLWKEFDTYKVGTAANSTSTMHSITDKEFVTDDFSWEDCLTEYSYRSQCALLNALNQLREVYLHGGTLGVKDTQIYGDWLFKNETFEPKDKRIWREIIQNLPSSYNQSRTVLMNYEVLAAQYKDRRQHRLTEWQIYCDWIESLAYSELIIGKIKED